MIREYFGLSNSSPPESRNAAHAGNKGGAQRNYEKATHENYYKAPSKATSDGNRAVALKLARAGFAVFPCRSDKRPIIDDWPDKATTDLAKIRRWWEQYPNAVPGLPTGKRNGLAVLDLDVRDDKDGEAALRAMGYNPNRMSHVAVRTPSGGRHVFFAYPEGLRNSTSQIAEGVDVRAEGGYVIAPEAVTAKGSYEYLRDDLSDMMTGLPDWPGALWPRRREAESDNPPLEYSFDDCREILDEIPYETWCNGDRDSYLAVIAAVHHALGGSTDARRLARDWAAQSPKYDAKHFRRDWESFGRHYTGSPTTMATLISDAPEWLDKRERLEVFDLLPDLPPLDPEERKGCLTFTRPSEIKAGESRPYVIKGLLAEGDVGCIVGAPGVGKSLLAPRLGYAVAQGREIFGARVRQGRVFYVAAEDEHGMRGRVQALKACHGDADDFQLVGGVSDLLSKGSAHLRELIRAVKDQRPSLIVIDTLALAFPGLEENTAEGMGRVVAVARALTKWGAAVLLIHHDTKDGLQGLPRGHSLLNGALDVALHLKPHGKIVRGSLTKNRNGSCDFDIAFRIDVRILGQDADGDEITAAFADECDSLPERQPLTPSEKAVFAALRDLGDDASMEDWRDACIGNAEIFPSPVRDNRRKAFARASGGLVEKGYADIDDDGGVTITCPAEVSDNG